MSGKMLSKTIAAATTGAVLQTELIPLSNQGKLRIYYNWLYSSLNCDPNNTSAFGWIINKLDDTHVSLSPAPANTYNDMTLYASVRDDYNWILQVQAPFSADWITAVGGDETIEMDSLGTLMVRFKGFNGQAIAVNGQITNHDGNSGYLLQSLGASDPKTFTWFMSVTQVLQPALQIPLGRTLSEADIREAYAASGLDPSDDDVARMQKLIG